MNQKILTTSKVPERKIDPRVNQGGGFIQTARPAAMTKDAFIAKYATEAEKDELIRAIEERRSKLPRWIYFVCDKCGWRGKFPFGDRDVRKRERPDYCPNCNLPGFEGGPVLRQMTAKEIRAYEKESAEKEARSFERAFKAGLFIRNQKRQEEGLPPLTEKQYRAEQRAEWERLRGQPGKP